MSFDLATFKRDLDVVPQFLFMGAPIQVSYKCPMASPSRLRNFERRQQNGGSNGNEGEQEVEGAAHDDQHHHHQHHGGGGDAGDDSQQQPTVLATATNIRSAPAPAPAPPPPSSSSPLLQIRQLRGYLGNVSSDVIVLLHCSSSHSSTTSTGAAAAAAAVRRDPFLDNMPNATLLRRHIMNFFPLEELVPLPSSSPRVVARLQQQATARSNGGGRSAAVGGGGGGGGTTRMRRIGGGSMAMELPEEHNIPPESAPPPALLDNAGASSPLPRRARLPAIATAALPLYDDDQHQQQQQQQQQQHNSGEENPMMTFSPSVNAFISNENHPTTAEAEPLLDSMDAESLLRRWIIQQAEGRIPESLEAHDFLMSFPGMHAITARRVLQRLEQIRSDLAASVASCAARVRTLGLDFVDDGGDGGFQDNLFNALDDQEIRVALRRRKDNYYSQASICNALLALCAAGGVAFAAYSYVAISGSAKTILDDYINGCRVTSIVVCMCFLTFAMLLAYEMMQLIDLQLTAWLATLRNACFTIMLPATMFALFVAGGLVGKQTDFSTLTTLRGAYSANLFAADTCTYFKEHQCAGFDIACSNAGSMCPSGCRYNDDFSRPCEPSLDNLVQNQVRPLLALLCLSVVCMIITFYFQYRLEAAAKEMINVVRPEPPEPADQQEGGEGVAGAAPPGGPPPLPATGGPREAVGPGRGDARDY